MALHEDSLEDYWNDISPEKYRLSLDNLIKRAPAFVGFPTGPKYDLRLKEALSQQSHVFLHASALSPLTPIFEMLFLKFGGRREILSNLKRAVHQNTPEKIDTITEILWPNRLLMLLLEDATISLDTVYDWVSGKGTTHEAKVAEFDLLVRNIHLFLIGGAYEVCRAHVIIAISDICDLVRTDLLSGPIRRQQAELIDNLLDEIAYWTRHFKTNITVILRWSGLRDDAILLQGLCEPLAHKVEASTIFEKGVHV